MFVTVAPGIEGRDRAGALRPRAARAGPARRGPDGDRPERGALEHGEVTPRAARSRSSGGRRRDAGRLVRDAAHASGENGRRRVYGRRRPAAPDRAARARRPRARRRGRVHAALVPPGGADGAPRPGRRAVVHAHVPPRRARARPEPPQRRADRSSDGRPRRDRLERQALARRGRSPCSRATGRRGLYAAKLETDDGRVGFAPFVLRPADARRDARGGVLPTNTWQAYNLYDADGDGWGDTWYAGGLPPVGSTGRTATGVSRRASGATTSRSSAGSRRPGASPDILADDDLEAFPSGDELRRPYDLVVFPGHSEYMTAHAYDVVERYRDLGGRLVFLSANNFFWGVEKRGNAMRRGAQWRAPARPEVRLLRCPVPGQRRRPAAGAVRRQRPRRDAVALRGHRPRARRHPRRGGRRVRDRDRHDDAGLAPGHARPRLDPEPVRARRSTRR